MQDVMTVIQTLGFPVACCVGLGYFLNKRYENDREDRNKREENIMETLGEVHESNKLLLDANKEVLEANRMLMGEYKLELRDINRGVSDIKDRLK